MVCTGTSSLCSGTLSVSRVLQNMRGDSLEVVLRTSEGTSRFFVSANGGTVLFVRIGQCMAAQVSMLSFSFCELSRNLYSLVLHEHSVHRRDLLPACWRRIRSATLMVSTPSRMPCDMTDDIDYGRLDRAHILL